MLFSDWKTERQAENGTGWEYPSEIGQWMAGKDRTGSGRNRMGYSGNFGGIRVRIDLWICWGGRHGSFRSWIMGIFWGWD